METVEQVERIGKSLAVRTFGALFIAAIPLALVLTNVQLAFNSLWLYEYGFERYQVATYTGIPRSDLIAASEGMIDFFNSKDEFPEIRVFKGGQRSTLFNAREVQHLSDVRDLLNRLMAIRTTAALYIIIYSVVVISFLRGKSILVLSSQVIKSGIGTVVGLMLFAVVSLFGFDQLFLQFHLISFSNDLWRLNPSTDYLLLMFPQGFWFDAAMLVGLATGTQALALFLVSKVYQILVRT